MANTNPFDEFDAAPTATAAGANAFDQFDTTAPKSASAPAPTPAAPQMTILQRVGAGIADPIAGVGQLAAHLAPPGTLEAGTAEFEAQRAQAGLPPLPPDATTQPELVANVDKELQDREAKIRAGTPPGTDWWRIAGNIVSPVNYMVPGGGAEGVAARAGKAALQGAGVAAMQPATGEGSFAGQKTIQTGVGAVAGGALSPLADAVGALGKWITKAKGPEAANDKALQTILSRIQADEKGGGPTAQDMLDMLATAPDKPQILADVGGEDLRSLVGRIARSPGEAKQIIRKFLTERDMDAGLRLKGDINAGVGRDSELQTFDALKRARSMSAKPLFEKAYQGGSLAPLKDQFETAFSDLGREESEAQKEIASAQNRVTAAAARQSQAGDNVYAVNGANEDMRAAQAQLQFAQSRLEGVQANKAEALESLRLAQDDIANNAPGAVWSPRIAIFLKNPRIQEGIQRGLRIERDETMAEGRAMNPSEYAIIGQDENGNAVIGKVPTMRLLAVAKQGLDRMLKTREFSNELTGELNQEGVALDNLRKAYLTELDRLNPDYKVARAQWAGDTQSMEALRAGEDIFKMKPEQITETISAMSPGDREFYKLGVAAKLREMVGKTGEQGNEARKVAMHDWMRDQLRAAFSNDEEYEKFIGRVDAENRMFKTKAGAMSNSITAERLAEDTSPSTRGLAAAHGLRGALEVLHGNPWSAYHFARAWEHIRPPKADQELNAAIARNLIAPPRTLLSAVQGLPVPPPSLLTQAVPWAVPAAAAGAVQETAP